MKNLVFIRHGKSSWDYDVSDEMRPLKKRGIEDGHLIGEELAEWDLEIDAIFSSPAKRAYSTCKIICQELDYSLEHVTVTNKLYDFGGEKVMRFINQLDDDLETVVLFGHNNAFTALVNSLGDRYIENVPTTGVVWITFQQDTWGSITPGLTKRTIFPKELK